jgi:hypothetical protein
MRGLIILAVLFAVSAWQHPHVADPVMKKAQTEAVVVPAKAGTHNR